MPSCRRFLLGERLTARPRSRGARVGLAVTRARMRSPCPGWACPAAASSGLTSIRAGAARRRPIRQARRPARRPVAGDVSSTDRRQLPGLEDPLRLPLEQALVLGDLGESSFRAMRSLPLEPKSRAISRLPTLPLASRIKATISSLEGGAVSLGAALERLAEK